MSAPPRPIDDRALLADAHRGEPSAIATVLRRYGIYSEALDRIARFERTPREQRTAHVADTIAAAARGPLP